jgi:hypothetical protein
MITALKKQLTFRVSWLMAPPPPPARPVPKAPPVARVPRPGDMAPVGAPGPGVPAKGSKRAHSRVQGQ